MNHFSAIHDTNIFHSIQNVNLSKCLQKTKLYTLQKYSNYIQIYKNNNI